MKPSVPGNVKKTTAKPTPPPPPAPVAETLSPEELLRKKEEDKLNAQEILKRKEFLKMRKENLKADQNRPDPSYFKTLDSSVKKNSAFIRKLATKITPESEASLIKEMKVLNLNRYIQEVVKEISAAPLRIGDIPCAINLCSLMHKYYPDFMPELVPTLKKIFLPEKNEPISRKRSTLRFLTELFTCGLYNDYNVVLGLVETVVEEFKDDNQTISLMLSFVRHGRRDLLGLRKKTKAVTGKAADMPKDESNSTSPGATAATSSGGGSQTPLQNVDGEEGDDEDEGEDDEDDEEIIDEAGRAKFVVLVKNFYKKASAYLVKLHMKLREKERENREIENTKGELSEEISSAYRKQREEYDKVLSNMSLLADQLQCDLPELPEEDKTTRMVVTFGNDLFKNTTTKESPLWDDEGMRAFYEDLEDLSIRVHPALLGLTGKAAENKEKENKDLKDTEKKDEEEKKEDEVELPVHKTEKEDKKIVEEDEKDTEEAKESTAGSASTPQQDRLTELLQRLESSINRDKIDQAAIDFCYVNSKGNRKKLVNFIFGVSRNKLEILPYYARLVATLNRYLKDIGSILVQKLEQEFDQLYAEKHQLKIESKIKNIRFLSELVKFKVCPTNVIFKCLKMCLDDFVHHNVDVACALLETCGRYLYKTPETQTRTQNLLERMIRLKASKNFDNKQETMIENAYYSCKPPDRPALVQKERSMTERYMRKLLYEELHQKTAHVVMTKFRKFDWNGNQAEIMKVLLKVHNCKYSTIPALASVVSGLNKYHDEFAVKLVDALLEEIRIGLEKNEYNYNQKLIAYIKFLGELYNYTLIDHPLVFDTLFNILGLSVHDDLLARSEETGDMSESPNDLFKIRLVCTLLDTCGEFFSRGSTKERLDRFLLYFQRFILYQIYIPRDVGFMVDDTLEALRPKMKRFKSYEEVTKAIEALEKKPAWGPKSYRIFVPKTSNSTQKPSEVDEHNNQFEDEDDANDDEKTADDENVAAGSKSAESDDEHQSNDDYDDDSVGIKPKASEYIPCPEDDEFSKQYEQMMNEDREQRKNDLTNRSSVLNMTIPMQLLRPNRAAPPTDPEGGVPFKVLVKTKGNKHKAIDLPIPQDSKLASQHLKIRSIVEQQQQEMKRLVLQYDERDRKQDEENKKKKTRQMNTTSTSPSITSPSNVESELRMGATPYLNKQPQQPVSPKRAAGGFYGGTQDTGIEEFIGESSPRSPSQGGAYANVSPRTPKAGRGGSVATSNGRGSGAGSRKK